MFTNRIIVILFSLIVVTLTVRLSAQTANDLPKRTPEEEAMKQTTRLVKELGIKDSARFDTIYRMHLKYARWRQKGLTRGENMQRMQAIHEELKHLLTNEEFETFMNHPSEYPHRPHGTQVLVPATPTQRTDSL